MIGPESGVGGGGGGIHCSVMDVGELTARSLKVKLPPNMFGKLSDILEESETGTTWMNGGEAGKNVSAVTVVEKPPVVGVISEHSQVLMSTLNCRPPCDEISVGT